MRTENLFDFSLHDPQLFKDAIGYSTTTTGFPPEMIEKDYFCTLVLYHLAAWGKNKLIFKGRNLPLQGTLGFLPTQRGP